MTLIHQSHLIWTSSATPCINKLFQHETGLFLSAQREKLFLKNSSKIFKQYVFNRTLKVIYPYESLRLKCSLKNPNMVISIFLQQNHSKVNNA